MNRHVVAQIEDLPPGARKIVPVGGAGGIAVFNVGGAFYAVRNRCPHKGGPLGCGRLRPHVIAPDVYEVAHEREGEILKCPWHNWEFDLKTGCALYDAKMRVKTYRVAVEDGDVVLYLSRESDEAE